MKKTAPQQPRLHLNIPWFLLPIAMSWLLLLFYRLDLRPPHHDEGINGWFVMKMWDQGFYRYDPFNYHGPLFFYLLQFSELLFGKGIVSLRLVTVFFGILNIVLVLAHRRFFGCIAWWAALAMAFSPAVIYYDRYAIHETVLIFFQLLFSFGYFTYIRKISWRTGVTCMTAGFLGAVMIKETFFIFFGTWLIAHLLVRLTASFLPESNVREELRTQPHMDAGSAFVPPDSKRIFLLTIGAGLGITLLVFSGFFMNPHGVIDMFIAHVPWLKTGLSSGHDKPFWAWIKPFRLYEWPALAALAATFLLGWRTSREGRLWCAVGVGTVLAYSLIPYKTPWLILNMIWPLCFVFGYTVESIAQRWPVNGKRMAYTVAAVIIAVSAGKAVRLNIFHPADPSETYAYSHTAPSIHQLTTHIERACARHPEANNMRIVVATRQTWPLPWLLSDYPNHYFTKLDAVQKVDSDVFLADIQDQDRVESMLDAPYYRVKGKLRDAYSDVIFYYRMSCFADTWQDGDTLIGPPAASKERAQ